MAEPEVIYLLTCQQGKYYVGKTNNIARRYEQHKSGRGAEWTKIYPPIRYDVVGKVETVFDEEYTTKIYMKQFGIDNVRGAQYVQINLPEQLRKELTQSLFPDRCFKCGQDGHFASECGRTKPAAALCQRCGRNNHKTENCFAKTHFTGGPIKNSPPKQPKTFQYPQSAPMEVRGDAVPGVEYSHPQSPEADDSQELEVIDNLDLSHHVDRQPVAANPKYDNVDCGTCCCQ
jgi:predicted GIY-YIG superfamily endonuclease